MTFLNKKRSMKSYNKEMNKEFLSLIHVSASDNIKVIVHVLSFAHVAL